jgi:hypothetical protein
MPLMGYEVTSTAKRNEASFADTVLICGKCARKLGPDGKVIRRSLKQALRSSCWAKVRLVDTRCFSLCPKGGQVLATVRRIGDRRLLVVEPGFDTENALDYLLRLRRNLHG